MKWSASVLQPAPAKAQEAHADPTRREANSKNERRNSLHGATSVSEAMNTPTTGPSASPPLLLPRYSGFADGISVSPSPKRPDLLAFFTSRTPNTSARQLTAAPRASPLQPPPPHQQRFQDASGSPRFFFTPSTSFRETPLKRRVQHIPVLSSGTPPRSSTVTSAPTASSSKSPLHESAPDLHPIFRSSAVGTSPGRSSTPKRLTSAPQTSTASRQGSSIPGRQEASGASHGGAPSSSLATLSQSTTSSTAPSSTCDGQKGRASSHTGLLAMTERSSGSPLTRLTAFGSPVVLVPTKKNQTSPPSTFEATVAEHTKTAEAPDSMRPAQTFSAAIRVRSSLPNVPTNEGAHAVVLGPAKGNINIATSGYTNRLVAAGASSATTARFETPRDHSGLGSVDGVNITVPDKKSILVSAPGCSTSPTAVGSPEAPSSDAAAKPVPRKATVVSTAVTTPSAAKAPSKKSDAKSVSASTTAAAGRADDSNNEDRQSSTTPVVDPKAGRRSRTPRSISQVKKSRDAPRTSTSPASPLACSSSPQTPHKSTTMYPGASPRTPKMSSSSGKAPHIALNSAAASPNSHQDAVRGGNLSSVTVTNGVPGVRSFPTVSAGPAVPLPSSHSNGTRSQRAATILSETLSVVRPMAPVVHVRIRPVLPSIGESSNHRKVYFLDHQNVMVVRTRPRASSANASMLTLPSTLIDLTAPRRGRQNGATVPMLKLSSFEPRTPRSFACLKGAANFRNESPAVATAGGASRREEKTSVSFAAAPHAAAISTAAALVKVSYPESPCDGDATLLRSPLAADSLMVSRSFTAATVPSAPSGADGRGTLGVTSNISPALGSVQPLSGVQSAPIAVLHNRTISWTSQGSDEQPPSSRLSCGSPSAFLSPQQPGFGFALGGAAVSSTSGAVASAPRRRPWLTTFKSFTEEEAPSVSTTPREPKAESCSGGTCAICVSGRGSSSGAAHSEAETSAPPSRKRGLKIDRKLRSGGISATTTSLPTAKTTARKNSQTATPSNVNLQASGVTCAPRSASSRRRASRSILGASVSVSEMSMTAPLKGGGGASSAVRLGGEDPYAGTVETEQQPQLQPRASAGNNSVSTSCAPTGTEQHYSFEFVHNEEATQADVFEESVLRFADEALLAQNVAIICYGPTGSGKTHSMMGSQVKLNSTVPVSSSSASLRTGTEKGQRSRGVSNSSTSSPAPLDVRGRPPHHAVKQAQLHERISGEDVSRVNRGSAEGGAHWIEEDNESDCTNSTRMGTCWQYGHVGHISTRNGGSAAPSTRRDDQRNPLSGGSGELFSRSSTMALESTPDIGDIEEMGILPRLVHTLLERRGETIAIRRDPDGEVTGRSASSVKSASQSTKKPNCAGALSLTLRHLTFYGIELYMDEMCDLLDPGKRPIQAVGDTGGLEGLCQRINEARDYRIGGRRGGANCGPKQTSRTGGGMSITSLADLRRAYSLAHNNRITARHAQNDASSRSHAIFLLQLNFDLIESTEPPHGAARGRATGEDDRSPSVPPHSSGHVQCVHSYVAMVDLAGCERVKQTKVEGAALREAQYINKSLSAISSVVLSLHHHNAHVPYRDSKLTRLLRPCLEGGRVLTLVHVSPCSSIETVNTLNFADQIRHTRIPTHRLTPSSLKHRELLDVFADLIDPMQGQWEAQVHRAQVQLKQLCADVRLSHFSRALGSRPRRETLRDSLSSDVVSELSAASEVDDLLSISSAAGSPEEGLSPVTQKGTEFDQCRFALRATMQRLMGPICSHHRVTMREAVRGIWRQKEQRVLLHQGRIQQRIDEMQAEVQRLTTANAKLSKENSTPLPRDPHALELSRRIRESTEELGEYTKEQAALVSLTTALRQRLAAQDDVEAAVDEQLENVQHRISQAMRTLSAAVAAHPPGDPPCGAGGASPKEPTLPTGSSSTTALAMNTNDDPELRDIAHQQLSLAKELAALRLETACFEIGTGLWEGLWARAMRKEIITAMEVEVFAMERILLHPQALALMITADYTDVDGDGRCVEETNGTALPQSARFSAYSGNGLGTVPRGALSTHALEANHEGTASLRHSTPDPSSPEASLSTLWARLNNYLQGGAVPGNECNGVAATQEKDKKDEKAATGQVSPLRPQCSHRDSTMDVAASAAMDRFTGSPAEEGSPLASSSEGLGLRSALAAGSCAGAVPAPSLRKVAEEPGPNPLMVLVTEEQRGQSLERSASASYTQSSRHNSGAAALLAALTPLSLSGSYEEEQVFQEACLQILLREGIPCEVCCLGESASYTLEHYILPSSADAPLVAEDEHEESTSNLFAAPVRYHIAATVPPCVPEERSGAYVLSSARRRASVATGNHSSPVEPLERPDGLKDACVCTTRQGRLRLVRVPRRPNAYVLEFVYSHQALPLAPRLQAALLGKPEEAFTMNPGKTNLEQMVDALPSVQGAAGRGGGAGGSSNNSSTIRSQGPHREHRLFSIPLSEPTLHLNLHVLEEGIPNMTTPVAATMSPLTGGEFPDVASSCMEDLMSPSLSSSSPALCVARRLEGGPQIVVEVRGVPLTASTSRSAISVTAKKTVKSRRHQQLHSSHRASSKAGATAGVTFLGGKVQPATGSSPHRNSQPSQGGATSSAPTVSTGPAAAAWSSFVLAKRLGNGGELILPSSCILSNTGCCSLVLRFPAPLFVSTSRVEKVEAVIGALCSILRPPPTTAEGRGSSSSLVRREGSARRRLSNSAVSTSARGAETAGSVNGSRQRNSLAQLPVRRAFPSPDLKVVRYAHVPYTMFSTVAGVPPTTPLVGESLTNSNEGLSHNPKVPSGPHISVDNTAALPLRPLSMTRSDSLDGLGVTNGGVLGHALQSSCSPSYEHQSPPGTPSIPHAPSHVDFSKGDSGISRGSSQLIAPTVPLLDEQSGATLQVQFYWIPTPLNITPSCLSASRKDSGGADCGGNHDDGAGRRLGAGVESRATGSGRSCHSSALVATATASASGVVETETSSIVRAQVQIALSMLAHLSHVCIGGRPAGDAANDGFNTSTLALAPTIKESFAAHKARQQSIWGGGVRPQGCPGTEGAQFYHAVAVAFHLRQLDTYRQRIRCLFRQQLYDAEDVNGDDVASPAPQSWLTGELGRGAYLRDVQGEVKRIIGLPTSTFFGSVSGGAALSLGVSTGRHTKNDDADARSSLLESEGGDAAPDTQVTVADAREACTTAVPWSVWQWAYRWFPLRQLLQGDSISSLGSGDAHRTDRLPIPKAEAAAAWLPSAVRSGGGAGSSMAASSSLPGFCSMPDSSVFAATASSSSDEEFVAGGDWLTEAKLAARSKRVWFQDVLADAVPYYLESCASAGL